MNTFRGPEFSSLLRNSDEQDPPRRESTIQRKPVANNVTVKPISIEEDPLKPIDGSEDNNSFRDTHSGHEWSPGILKGFPYRGAVAVFLCLSCIIASIIILVVSDGQPTADWRVSPTVYLALFTTGINLLARFAFHEGAKIAWWYKALRGGTLNDLHNYWTQADGFWYALLAGRSFNFLSLASIAVTIMVIDQPLIQRASTVVSVSRTDPVFVTAPIAPEIPWGFTGAFVGAGAHPEPTNQVMSQPMIQAFLEYNSQKPISSGFSGCKDNCTGLVEAAGFAAKCNSTTGPILYFPYVANLAENLYVSPFSVSFDLLPSNFTTNVSSQLVLKVAFTNNTDPNDPSGQLYGLRTERLCYLAPATLRYAVKLTGTTVEINEDVLSPQEAPHIFYGDRLQIQSFTPRAEDGSDSYGNDYERWTLGGIYLAARNLFSANTTITTNGGLGLRILLPDTASNQFLLLPNQTDSSYNLTELSYQLGIPSNINNFTDPTSTIISSLNELMFRVSLKAATYPFRNTTLPPTPQNITMLQTSTLNVFKSDWRFLIGSTILSTICILLVIPTFMGFWEIGRSVTLNPVETAKAFDAPLLHGPGSNAPLYELIPYVGARNVKLGEVESYVEGSSVVRRQLKLGFPIEVTKPKAGVVYE